MPRLTAADRAKIRRLRMVPDLLLALVKITLIDLPVAVAHWTVERIRERSR